MAAVTPPVELADATLLSAGSDEEFLLHLAALEWSLADPIVIESAQDVKSAPNWQDRIRPFQHQMQNLMTFCRRLPVTLIADDVGLGKTISAGLILSELMTRRRVRRALVLCPSILGPQWVEEMESKFGIIGRQATGQQLRRELQGQAPLVVTTYESGSRGLEHVSQGDFDFLILDEAHKLRNLYGSNAPPKLAVRIHDALSKRLFKYVLMLTATPIQNRLWDLYTLVDCLATARGHANPFGSEGDFQRQYIKDAAARLIRPQAAEKFRSILRQYLVRTRREQVQLSFPERQVRLFPVPPTRFELSTMREVARHIARLNGFQQSSVLQAMMSSSAALVSQLNNMRDKNPMLGLLADQLGSVSEQHDSSKLNGLLQIVQELRNRRPGDWRLVVFTIRKETQRIIGKALQERGVAVGYIRGGEPKANYATVAAYSKSPPEINVIVSTDAGAEGLNLQAGNNVVNFDLPWNPMVVEQRIGRVQRLAAQHKHVVVINLVVRGSPEEKVVARLMEKLQVISDTVGDIEAVLEQVDSGEGSASFESQIRELVVKSLMGQDVDRATAQATESIQKAKELFERHRQEIDERLGDLSELHQTGPSMPKLRTMAPSMPFREFVTRGLTGEGAQVVPRDSNWALVRRRGQPEEEIAFDEALWQSRARPGAFRGRAPSLYLPGKPAFERLVERWRNRSAHRIADLRPLSQPLAEDLGRRIAQRIEGAEFLEAHLSENESRFTGAATCRMSASNALDSYEKLIVVPIDPAVDLEVVKTDSPAIDWMEEEFVPGVALPDLADRIEQAAAADPDLTAFSSFYEARLHEELRKGREGGELHGRLAKDLQPALHGQVLAIRGAQYERCRGRLSFAVDGRPGYALDLDFLPAVRTPDLPVQWARCDVSGRTVPKEWLERCQLSGQTVLKHLLVTSEFSRRRILESLSCRCPVTGKIAAQDEFLTSDLSGKTAAAAAFLRSPVSGRLGLPEEFARCEFTGDDVLEDELLMSSVSRKKLRQDQTARSAVSGATGHYSEFVRCAYTGDVILPSEGCKSDLDGALIRADKIIRSELPPFRAGAPSQFVTCSQSGMRLLRDEADACAVTGKVAARQYLEASDESGALALPEAFTRCSLTQKRILPSESVQSAISGVLMARSAAARSEVSGKFAAPSEIVRCQITGAVLLPDEAKLSSVSGKRFRSDQAAVSDLSGQVAHVSETARCAFTGRTLLKTEAAASEVSGKLTAQCELLRSEKSGRLGRAEEMVSCALSGKRLARDEVAASAVSGRLADVALMSRSAASGRLALPSECVHCEQTGVTLLPEECGVCAASQQRVDRRLLATSDVSAAKALPDKMARCSISNKRVLPAELETCALTGQRMLPNYLETCAATNQRIRRDRLMRSQLSDRYVQPSLAVRLSDTGQLCCPDEAMECVWTGRKLSPQRAVRCRRTQLVFSRDLLNEQGEFATLSALMEGRLNTFQFDDLVPTLRNQLSQTRLKTAKRAWGIASSSTQVRAVCVEYTERLGFVHKYAALIWSDAAHKVLGRITVSAPNRSGWELLPG